MRSNNIRIRFMLSLALVMVPILIFSATVFFSTTERSKQYINNMHLQNFTYAADNIATVIDRLDNASITAFSVENEIELDENGNVTIPSISGLSAALGVLESRMFPKATTLFYIKGDRYIYGSDGRQVYSDYENSHLLSYSLTDSTLFTKLQRISERTLIPMMSREKQGEIIGLAYAVPYPAASASKGVLIFVLSDNVIEEEIANYMGDLPGSIYMCDSTYNLLYENEGLDPQPDADDVLRLRGTGVLSVELNGESLMLLRVLDSKLGLRWQMLSRTSDFYQSMFLSQRISLGLILALIVLMLVLFVWMGFFNYKPVHDLFYHITGFHSHRNELEMIRTYYDHIAEEVDALSARINEMMPLMARRFIRQLVFGYITNEAEFRHMASRADLDFSARYNVAMYFIFPRETDEDVMERAATMLLHLSLRNAYLALIELYSENALCIIINFNAPEGNCDERAEQYAHYLYDYIVENLAAPTCVGIGSSYEDPLKLNESFAEANAAVQLAPPGAVIWRYGSTERQDETDGEDSFHGLSSVSLSLLKEGMNRGDKSTAIYALNDLLCQLSEATHSIAFYRFYCSELVTSLLRTADNLSLSVSKPNIQQLISITSQDKFSQDAIELVSSLCDEMKKRRDDEEDHIKRDVLDYILNNFRRNDLSIQTVADETGIRRAQITLVIKEETGLGFVQYVSYLRINEFKRLLLHSDETIRELVLQVGYTDVPNFLRKFKQLEGVTPSQYRQQMREE